MQLTRKTKIIIASVSVLTSFAVGRYTVPEKVKVETKTVTVEKILEKQDTNVKDTKHQKIVTTTKRLPTGEVDTTTTTTDDDVKDTDVKDDKTTDIASSTDSVKEVTRGDSKLTLSALAGFNINQKTPVYGLSLTKPVLGPLTIGVWGLSDSTVGLSLGLTF